MKHDLQHEMKQDEAIRLLAGALGSLAGALGKPDVVKVVAAVDKCMADDEVEAEEPHDEFAARVATYELLPEAPASVTKAPK